LDDKSKKRDSNVDEKVNYKLEDLKNRINIIETLLKEYYINTNFLEDNDFLEYNDFFYGEDLDYEIRYKKNYEFDEKDFQKDDIDKMDEKDFQKDDIDDDDDKMDEKDESLFHRV